MLDFGELSFSNFRSLGETVTLPFSRKTTLVIGPNNSGKSNILRMLAVLWNRAFNGIDPLYDFPGQDKDVRLTFSLTPDYIQSRIGQLTNAQQRYSGRALPLKRRLRKDAHELVVEPNIIIDTFPDYVNTRLFTQDFGGSSSPDANSKVLLDQLDPLQLLPGSVYLPNLRFINPPGAPVQTFVTAPFPGETVSFTNVVPTLASMDRPSFDSLHLRERLKRIEDFMAHCLDCKSVAVGVPDSKDTIHVTIDGDVRRIGSLGTGVEQLLMIGLTALGFGEKLVLIDEPELHLHPRSQRRLIRYLDEQVDARMVIATHSASVLDAIEADVVHVSRAGNTTTCRTIKSNADRYQLIRELGHSPSELLQTRYAIWVEGPSDRIYLNRWIARVDPDLVEGIDYTILFYGGSILARHSFEDIELDAEVDPPDLVRALSLSRAFAVLVDSDQHPARPDLKPFKVRVQEEVKKAHGLFWITAGREVENYIGPSVLATLEREFPYAHAPKTDSDQVLERERADKVAVARRAVELDEDEWPLDLRDRLEELVAAIRAQR